MEITLRGKKYQADNLTDINFFPLGMLFVDAEGRSLINDLTDYQSLPQATKLKMMAPLLQKLMCPVALASIARSIAAIFPSIPTELVKYSKESFDFNLSAAELLQVAVACGNELQLQLQQSGLNESQSSLPPQEAFLDPELLQSQEHKLAELQSKISALSSLPSFEGLDEQISRLKSEYDDTRTWLESFMNLKRITPTL
jgi:hypothetical protein